ncbi:MAG: 2Fe-2S iron-sulfur cluster binding domain-containing protein [Gammaproteobacteria bacterium]|nr:2Fe-2S iron-sulfur cluster binding domain-containing protein [Gammaproteobacteria bacterium]MBU1443666.1 2Fe-2S iron-sulfur cluster binding domain-containing protein [Gammaproteobacteria bacterium]MBU2288615.1 2Fe-2S iron-sulfur cluster binding domain-containing protein [Gammaproteobacteria bacterium]
MLQLTVNGQPRQADPDVRTSLLDLLRDSLGLVGAKKGCDHGQCGACTVIVNGRRINSCLSLAVMHDGDEVTTIEGLGTPEQLSAMQQAFHEHDAYQCGFCTPGQICSATAVLEEVRMGWPSHVSQTLDDAQALDRAEIAERMSGNLCRCSAYPNINDAIAEAARKPDHQAKADGGERP